MKITPPTFKILYNNVNITEDISDHIISITYTDKVEGESDEIEINLQDADLLWQNAWYPKKGARLDAQMEQDGRVLNCGSFAIDEIEMSTSRSGDVVAIRGLAAFVTKKIRTKKSTAHENKTLREIAVTIAANNGLQVVGNIDNIVFKRITQHQQTDLNFLKHLAGQYGYIFSIRGNVITFTSIYELEAAAAVCTLDKTDLLTHSIKDKATQVYKAAKVKHHSSQDNINIEAEEITDNEDFSGADILEIKSNVENKQQAEAVAKAALHKANSLECTGAISIPGNPLIVAGINFELTGMGSLSGINQVITSTHSIDRGSGYTTTAEFKRIKKIDASKYKPKTLKKSVRNVAELKPINPVNPYTFNNATGNYITGGAVNNF